MNPFLWVIAFGITAPALLFIALVEGPPKIQARVALAVSGYVGAILVAGYITVTLTA